MEPKNESIEEMTDRIAHEFNNFLTGIQNYVNLAKLCTTNRQVVKYLDNTLSIVNSAQMFTKFIRDSKKIDGTGAESRSNAPGDGTENSECESENSEISAELPFCQGKILLMDDEKYIRFATCEILKRKQYTVTTASEGKEALDIFQRELRNNKPFDLVILDLTVSEGMGGVETLNHLIKIDPKVKAIASSGYSEDAVMANPQEFGFAAALKKPYPLHVFLDLISEVINT